MNGKNGFVHKVQYENFTGKAPTAFAQKVPYQTFTGKVRKGVVQMVSYDTVRECNSKKVSTKCFRTKPSKSYSCNEGALGNDKSFSNEASVNKVDFGEIRKTPEGCFSLAVPSKVILMLLEF